MPVVGLILDVLGNKYLELMDLDLSERHELKGNGYPPSDREALARNNNVVVQLVLLVAANGNWLNRLQ